MHILLCNILLSFLLHFTVHFCVSLFFIVFPCVNIRLLVHLKLWVFSLKSRTSAQQH